MIAAQLIVLIVLSRTGTSEDACLAQVPASLRTVLSKSYPTHRLPRASDNDEMDRKLVKKDAGACLGVARGDFDGDGAGDVALRLAAKDGREAIFLVALQKHGGWKVEKLAAWGEWSGTYIQVAPPGLYDRIYDSEGDREPGEVSHLESRLPGVCFGRVASSGVAYFLIKDHWVHVWVSD